MYLILTAAIWDKCSAVWRPCHWLYGIAIVIVSWWTELFVVMMCSFLFQCFLPWSGLCLILRWHACSLLAHFFSFGSCFKCTILLQTLPSTFLYPYVVRVSLVSTTESGFAFWSSLPIFVFKLGHLAYLHLIWLWTYLGLNFTSCVFFLWLTCSVLLFSPFSCLL